MELFSLNPRVGLDVEQDSISHRMATKQKWMNLARFNKMFVSVAK
jgi:hypothetical protein